MVTSRLSYSQVAQPLCGKMGSCGSRACLIFGSKDATAKLKEENTYGSQD